MNEIVVHNWTRGQQAHQRDKQAYPYFYKAFMDIVMRLTDWISSEKLGVAASWLLYHHRWLSNRLCPLSPIVPGNILEVDLGVNYCGEYSLRHPCIVLRKKGPLVTVVPLTTQDLGKGITVSNNAIAPAPVDPADKYKFRIEFTPHTGRPSAALVEQTRTVHTGRILEKWVDAATRKDVVVPRVVLEAIQRSLLEMMAPLMHARMTTLQTANRRINEKKNRLLKDLITARKRIEFLEESLRQREQQLEQVIDYYSRAPVSPEVQSIRDSLPSGKRT